MQLNRGLITGFDAGHHHMLADLPRPCDQGDQQRFANPFTAMRLMDIHRVFYGMAIAVLCAPVAERRIADRLVRAVHRHQHRVARRLPFADPRRAIGASTVCSFQMAVLFNTASL